MTRGAASAALILLAMLSARAEGQPACAPTRPDMLGPFDEPNAPERSVTGRGLVITGRVSSTQGCTLMPGALIEWWSANPRGDYGAEHRAAQRPDGPPDAGGGHRRLRRDPPERGRPWLAGGALRAVLGGRARRLPGARSHLSVTRGARAARPRRRRGPRGGPVDGRPAQAPGTRDPRGGCAAGRRPDGPRAADPR